MSPALQYLRHPKLSIALHQESPCFFPKNTLFRLYWLRLWSFQQIADPQLPLLSFDLSVHITRPAQSFVASLNACFLQSIIISPWNLVQGLITSTCSTPSAGSIE